MHHYAERERERGRAKLPKERKSERDKKETVLPNAGLCWSQIEQCITISMWVRAIRICNSMIRIVIERASLSMCACANRAWRIQVYKNTLSLCLRLHCVSAKGYNVTSDSQCAWTRSVLSYIYMMIHMLVNFYSLSQLNNSLRGITRFSVRGRTQLAAILGVNCRTHWALSLWMHIAAST